MTVTCTTDNVTEYVKCHWGMERAEHHVTEVVTLARTVQLVMVAEHTRVQCSNV